MNYAKLIEEAKKATLLLTSSPAAKFGDAVGVLLKWIDVVDSFVKLKDKKIDQAKFFDEMLPCMSILNVEPLLLLAESMLEMQKLDDEFVKSSIEIIEEIREKRKTRRGEIMKRREEGVNICNAINREISKTVGRGK
jgi:carbamoylphosphate synthase large subunit